MVEQDGPEVLRRKQVAGIGAFASKAVVLDAVNAFDVLGKGICRRAVSIIKIPDHQTDQQCMSNSQEKRITGTFNVFEIPPLTKPDPELLDATQQQQTQTNLAGYLQQKLPHSGQSDCPDSQPLLAFNNKT